MRAPTQNLPGRVLVAAAALVIGVAAAIPATAQEPGIAPKWEINVGSVFTKRLPDL